MNESVIFTEALKLATPAERAAYLDRVCAGDPQLRAAVDALLAANAADPNFLEQPPESLGGTVDEPGHLSNSAPDPSEQPGYVLAGRYKLLERIGEGGMGTVWMAQQTEPVKRLVAVKLIKAGMDSKQVLARFEAERQALALMDHPNIAKVFDGGVSDGRPYFVMELVKGVPITKYCDERHLTPQKRLELFVPVCHAIQHAHQKGIIHRDLKPSNVLVALYDDKPVPKVIDFGVAKATGQQLTEQTLHTGFGAVVGTLEYMSPEQASFNQLDVDTRSDIYSLGVLLYELLAGSPPFSKKDLEKAGMLEMLRVIREKEPSKPSTKLSSSEALPTLSANRGTEPAKLTRLVRGELDWIVMKSLEKDRSRRYETANGFAMDIQRYLADEPVLACPPSAWYRLRKLARRNKTALAVAGLILFFIALLGGGGGWVLRDRAARQVKAVNDLDLALERAELFQGQGKRPEALAALERAELLAGQVPADVARDARLAAVKERLDAEARDQAFLGRFEDILLRVSSQVDVEKSHFIGSAAYREIREALRNYGIEFGITAPADVAACVQGRPEPIRGHLVAALDECFRWVPKMDPEMRPWLLATLAAADNDAWRIGVRQAWDQGDWQTLEQLAKGADMRKQPPSFLTRLATNLPAQTAATRLDLLRRTQRSHPADLWANHELAYELQKIGQPAEAVRYYTAALALRPDNPGIYVNRGTALRDAGEVDAAIVDAQQAVALAPRYAMAHTNLGESLRVKGQLDKAIAAHREAIGLKKDLPLAHFNLGNALKDKGQLEDAIAAYHEAIRLKKDYAEAYNNLGAVYSGRLGQPAKALIYYCRAVELDPKHALTWANRGNAYWKLGQYDQAIADHSQAIARDPTLAAAWIGRGLDYVRLARYDKAVADYSKAIEMHPTDVDGWRYRGSVYCDNLGQPEKAVADFSKAIELEPKEAVHWSNRGNAYRNWGQYEKAVADYSKAIELEPKEAVRWSNRANAYRKWGQYEKAVADYSKAIEVNPKHADAHNDLAWLLATCPEAKLRDPNRAVELAKKAVELAPQDGSCWGTLGTAHYRAGDWKSAVASLDKSRALLKGYDAYAWLFLAMAHRKLGNDGESRKAYDQAVKWLEKNKEMLAKTTENADELRRFRSEAEEVLELKKK
jgi:tetratricopeptide (TPR) repeat protein